MSCRPVGIARWPVSLSGLLLAALCGMVLWGRVYLDFDGVRLKVLQASRPAVGGTVSVTVPESPRLARLAAPVVIIARVRNAGPRAEPIAISLAGVPLAAVTLAPGHDRRIDIVVPDEHRVHAGDVLTFAGAGAAVWSLDYLEVANHHGSSRSILSFTIVPRATQPSVSPGVMLIASVTIAVALLVPYGMPLLRMRRIRLAQIALTSIVALVFSIVVVSGTFSAFKLLLAPASFFLCAIAVTWPGVVRSFIDVREAAGRRSASARALFDAAVVAVGVALFYVLIARALLVTYESNYSGFMQFGSQFADRVPFLTDRPDLKRQLRIGTGGGYDGQFFYAMAFDPFLLAFKDNPIRYRDVVDAPPYRYGRIGFPLLTMLFSGDRPERYPQTMVSMIIAGSVVGALLLAAIAQHYESSPAWGLLFVLVPGFVQSLHVALPETIAAAGLLGGYWLLVRGRAGWAAALLAASLLLRETGIIFVIALVVWQAWRVRDRRAAGLLAASALPVVAWRAYVGWRLFADLHWDAVFFNPRNMGMPFKGILDMWRLVWSGQYLGGAAEMAASAIFYPLLLTAGLAIGAYLFYKRRDGLSGAILAYACLAVSLNYEAIWCHVGNAERGTYELFLLLIVAFVSIESSERVMRRLVGAVLVCTLLYLWFASVDAGLVRYSVLS